MFLPCNLIYTKFEKKISRRFLLKISKKSVYVIKNRIMWPLSESTNFNKFADLLKQVTKTCPLFSQFIYVFNDGT